MVRSADWLQDAVINNADWCATIARSHGLASHTDSRVWFCEARMPPFYPNLITLTSSPEIPRELGARDHPPGWGVKDSFAVLDLSSGGFHEAFTAQWYFREAAPLSRDSALDVKRVGSVDDFIRWLDAWGETPEGSDIFLPALLEETNVEMLYAEKDGQLTGGLIVNLSGRVSGISNFFGEPGEVLDCVQAVADGSRAVVGYGGRTELELLQPLGFEVLGELRVWLKS